MPMMSNTYQPYSSYGGGAYSSPYNRYSGYSGYGGYGGYGNRYAYGQRFGNEESLEPATMQAFQILDQIVQAFAGFSQMLESTFHATHSSFMAMMSVAEQFGNLKNYLSQLFNIMAMFRSLRDFTFKLIGKRPPSRLDSTEFDKYTVPPRSSSSKPFWIFLSLVIGLPWLMNKLVKILQRKKIQSSPSQKLDIKNLDFGRAIYDFQGESPQELTFKKGDLIAILSQYSPNEPTWVQGRLQSGAMGLFPSNYIELIPRKPETVDATASMETLTSDSFSEKA
jgi:peroxin-13